MANKSTNRKYLNIFFNKKGKKKCAYCSKIVIRADRANSIQKHNTATIDHIYSKSDIRRLIIAEVNNIKLCCHECNQRKDELENLKIKVDYLNLGYIHCVMTNVGVEIIPDEKYYYLEKLNSK